MPFTIRNNPGSVRGRVRLPPPASHLAAVRITAHARRALEGILSGETGQGLTMYDHYVARLADIFDMLALASRVSHA